MTNASKNPLNTVCNVFRNRTKLPCVMDNPVPSSGVINGATSMAPMTTAAESMISPPDAMIVDMPSKAIKSTSHCELL